MQSYALALYPSTTLSKPLIAKDSIDKILHTVVANMKIFVIYSFGIQFSCRVIFRVRQSNFVLIWSCRPSSAILMSEIIFHWTADPQVLLP